MTDEGYAENTPANKDASVTEPRTVDRTETVWTNLPNDATVLAFPACARCGHDLYGAIYSQREVKTYEAVGVTPDGDVAEFEHQTLSDGEPNYVPLVTRREPHWSVVECDECHEQYAPVVRENVVTMEPAGDTHWEGDL